MTREIANGVSSPDTGWHPADRLCDWVRRKKLETPASLFLEMHRPLMPLAWPAATLCGTFLAPFLGGPRYYEDIEALRDPAFLDALLARLAKRDAPKAKPAAGGDKGP